jgi:hypothetical protein
LNSVYVWSRREPYLLKIPIKTIKRFCLKEREKIEGDAYLSIKRNRKGLFSNKLFQFFWINFSLIEYLFLTYFKILRPNRNRDLLICDRYLHDAIVDFVLSCSIPLSKYNISLSNLISKWFPKPDRLYFIDISAEIGMARKKDGTSLAYLADRVPVYQSIAQKYNAFVIDGTLSMSEINKIIIKDSESILKKI